ncbi:transcriptional regulator, TetR family [Actinoalloteichus sp. GBA129-24]|uniref:Transcriptional regulator, TetR family n=1 Tax=Actinoalloteichus fjordicus TaxID=1612552 RepID=A0AAC9PRS6_9PSEU|nr:transcriptional regulator, TetR family [Actinoalloteichus fjordicus]APU20687.1 transcriptional regulator, TetR family [Actinoalloteichus sp. GBA129-24]
MTGVPNRSAETRARIQECALELFARNGYAATRVVDIAAAAGVSHMTFFRHFPTKEDVVLEDPFNPFVADLIAAQPLGLPVLERVRLGLLNSTTELPEWAVAQTRERIRLAACEPVLRDRFSAHLHATERCIVDRLIEQAADPLTASTATAACLAALRVALLDWGEHGEETLNERIVAALGVLGPTAQD